ncbi:hypothetical protein RhiirA4_457302 [Rhizophagus irregularis]|uniref:Uncharacterized protein n=1 Tax=Rhizophagus irregularis TaxID=588596 RepID=A0A2I1G9M6_9GLOM|nr:hypothetical protein RhiirA4_457302 [Rhizophagus irregularis]
MSKTGEGSHSGKNIASKLFEDLREFNLLSKILGISTDIGYDISLGFESFRLQYLLELWVSAVISLDW